MGKRQRIVLTGLLIVVLGGFIWLLLRQREPVYQGKSLSVWLAQYSTNRWPLDKQAGAAIRHIGTNATPILLKRLGTRENPVTLKLLSLVPKQWLVRLHLPGVEDYQHQVDEYRRLGAHGFMALGEVARSAVPALITLLNDQNLRVRYLAVFALRCLGPVAADALPSLIKCLDDPDFAVRDDAVMGLGTIHQEPDRVVPLLINFIATYRTDRILCQDAVGSLGKFGPQARPAIPLLLGLLNRKEPVELRSHVLQALGEIHVEPELVMPVLISSLRDPEADFKKAAIASLRAFGIEARLAVPDLVDLLADPSEDVRNMAASTLKQIDPEAAAKAGVK